MNSYNAIEIHGRKNNIFCIKEVCNDVVNPVDRIAYKSLDDALISAEKLGLKIEKIGSFYEII